MSEKPMLFNTEMVKAILDGRKTVTRRVIKFPPGMTGRLPSDGSRDYLFYPGGIKYPPYQPSDILYVRETWARIGNEKAGRPMHYEYRADCANPNYFSDGFMATWRPSIHMPKEAARIFLRVTDVRVEKLQEIQERGPMSAEHEGFVNDIDLIDGGGKSATRHFADIWDSTIKKSDMDKYGWAANPFVWVIAFERVGKEEALKNEP